MIACNQNCLQLSTFNLTYGQHPSFSPPTVSLPNEVKFAKIALSCSISLNWKACKFKAGTCSLWLHQICHIAYVKLHLLQCRHIKAFLFLINYSYVMPLKNYFPVVALFGTRVVRNKHTKIDGFS